MLDRRYSWVKCNENFRGYYVNDYSPDQFDAFQTILMQDMDVNFGLRLITFCYIHFLDVLMYLFKLKSRLR